MKYVTEMNHQNNSKRVYSYNNYSKNYNYIHTSWWKRLKQKCFSARQFYFDVDLFLRSRSHEVLKRLQCVQETLDILNTNLTEECSHPLDESMEGSAPREAGSVNEKYSENVQVSSRNSKAVDYSTNTGSACASECSAGRVNNAVVKYSAGRINSSRTECLAGSQFIGAGDSCVSVHCPGCLPVQYLLSFNSKQYNIIDESRLCGKHRFVRGLEKLYMHCSFATP